MYGVGRENEAVAGMSVGNKAVEIETLFRMHYARVARMIGRVVRDRGRAEELAGEVFLKLWRKGVPELHFVEGWLYRVAVNAALDDVRRETRRARYEGLLKWLHAERQPATPEEMLRTSQEQQRVRAVLGTLATKHSELLLLQSQELNYEEIAEALQMNRKSVGARLARAREAFRKEYIQRYGSE